VYSVLAAGKRRQRQYVREGRREERERTLNNRIDRARFLAELDGRKGMSTDNEEGKAIVTYTAVDALGHVRVVLLAPSSRASDSIVIACAGQMASQSLQAMEKASSVPCKRKENERNAPMHRSSPEAYRRRACSPRKR
jgi:hypothetical protein